MILHKILRGPDAGLYLPFGLARLRALQSVYGTAGFFQEKYVMPGFIIEVQQTPPFQYVRVTAVGGVAFEFATTANPIITDTIVQAGVAYSEFRGCVIKAAATAAGIKSSVSKQRRSAAGKGGADVSGVARVYQNQLLNEPVAYPQSVKVGSVQRYPVGLYESWAPGNPHTGVFLRATQSTAELLPDSTANNPISFSHNPGPLLNHDIRDVGFDIPFQEGHGTAPLATAYIRDGMDWPRANGLQLVKDAVFGTREFAIYVDASNTFAVFPTSQIGPLAGSGIDQNVDGRYVRRVAPSLPGWVYAPSTPFKNLFATDPSGFIQHNAVDAPEFDWKFNHLGTRCASIVYEREPYANDPAYWAINASGTPFDSTRFAARVQRMGIQTRFGLSFAPGHNDQRYFVAPGIVEFTVTITLTGFHPEEFRVDISAAREVRRPTTSTLCPVLVGYVWYDIPGVASAGDFVAVDVEHWGNAEPFPDILSTNILSVKNLDTDAELLSYPACTYFNLNQVGAAILDADLRTLSFAFLVQNFVRETRSVPVKAGAGGGVADTQWNTLRFGVAIAYRGGILDWIFPATLAGGDQTALQSGMATSGRAIINALVAGDGNWARVSLNESLDGFAHTNFAGYRDYWGYASGYKATDTSSLTLAQRQAVEALTFGIWKAGLNTGETTEHLWLCDHPRWGWHCYSNAISMALRSCPDTTFYMHPNGTWAFWNNSHIYNAGGTIEGSGDFASFDTLPLFDAALVEHVIFDKVSFAFIDANGDTTRKNSSFLQMYNDAVVAGRTAGTLNSGILPIAAVDLRAAFTKDSFTYGTGEEILSLRGDWDGTSYWYLDSLVAGGAYEAAPQQTAGWGSVCGVNFDQPWSLTVDQSGGAATPAMDKHVRFANPLLLAA